MKALWKFLGRNEWLLIAAVFMAASVILAKGELRGWLAGALYAALAPFMFPHRDAAR